MQISGEPPTKRPRGRKSEPLPVERIEQIQTSSLNELVADNSEKANVTLVNQAGKRGRARIESKEARTPQSDVKGELIYIYKYYSIPFR